MTKLEHLRRKPVALVTTILIGGSALVGCSSDKSFADISPSEYSADLPAPEDRQKLESIDVDKVPLCAAEKRAGATTGVTAFEEFYADLTKIPKEKLNDQALSVFANIYQIAGPVIENGGFQNAYFDETRDFITVKAAPDNQNNGTINRIEVTEDFEPICKIYSINYSPSSIEIINEDSTITLEDDMGTAKIDGSADFTPQQLLEVMKVIDTAANDTVLQRNPGELMDVPLVDEPSQSGTTSV
jgi:hypothetical protein